jgi:phosphoribosylformylglycinamidine cyclo-ligase
MNLSIDLDAKTPVHRQIADQIRFAIQTGKLAPGEKLPSLRSLAAKAGVAVNTVAKAYKSLEATGAAQAGQRSAYTVCPKPRRTGRAPKADDSVRYAARGVSATKSEVHGAIAGIDKGVFPGSFCKITEDYLTGDPDLCNLIHADGSGTKSILAYLQYRETGDPSVFRGIAQDSIVMNLDDLLCVGATGRILISSTINRNAKRIPGEVLAELIGGTEEVLGILRGHGVDIHSGGGETADVGDLTPTVVVDSCATAIMKKKQVVTGGRIKPGLAIVGLASDGQASYETVSNSGIGSNGLTSARHDLLSSYYRRHYPETFDKQIDKDLVYCGPYRLKDPLKDSSMTVGEALLSPTRSYAPVISALLRDHPGAVRGLVHCSGGGQTKCLHFGRNVHYVKDAMMPIPPIFRAIQHASGTGWKEMYRVYNMGHRMEVYCPPSQVLKVINCVQKFGIEAAQIGHTQESPTGNRLTLMHGRQKLSY